MSSSKGFELVDRAINFEGANPMHNVAVTVTSGTTMAKRQSQIAKHALPKEESLYPFRLTYKMEKEWSPRCTATIEIDGASYFAVGCFDGRVFLRKIVDNSKLVRC
jgi:hypothetical protein